MLNKSSLNLNLQLSPQNAIRINSCINLQERQQSLTYYNITHQMSLNTCPKHNRTQNVIDLDRHIYLCQRCALFDPNYQHHSFIEAQKMPEYAEKLYEEFNLAVKKLNLENKEEKTVWISLQESANEAKKEKVNEVNRVYDQLVEQIEKERKEKINKIDEEVSKITAESYEAVTVLVKDKYETLCKKQLYLSNELKDKKYLKIAKALGKGQDLKNIDSIEKELSILKVDLQNKLKGSQSDPLKDLTLSKKKISAMEELLLQEEPTNEFLDMNLSFSKDTCSSNCKTEISFFDPQTDRNIAETQSQLQKSRQSTASTASSKTKTIINKSEIKNIFIRNSVRTVVLSKLLLNNREALDAVKRSTNGNFVSKIDLSQNQLTSQFISLLKRQKNFSKYLKTIVVKGIKIDNRALTKEGISLDTLKDGKLQIGEFTLEI